MANETWCEDCEHLHPPSERQHPATYLCTRFPNPAGHGFVMREKWAGEPYLRCFKINTGNCPMFKMKLQTEIDLEGDETETKPT